MTSDTHAYVTEAAATGAYATDTILDGFRAFVPHLNNAAEQSTALRQKLQLAMMSETDTAVAALFEEAAMQIRNIIRIASEVQLGTTQLAKALADLDAVNARITGS